MTRYVWLVFSGLVLVLSGCYVPSPKLGKTETLQQKVGLAGAESASVSITIGVGKLKLTGGADSLLDARFEYNIPDWKPVVSYKVEDGRGGLIVEQPSRVVGATWPGNVRYDWDLKLKSGVPLELEVDMGVGKSEVDLRGLDVRHLSLEAGVGELKLVLPADVGVRVEAQGGLGHVDADGLKAEGDAWVNESWGKTKASLRIEVEAGIGEVEMRLVGSAAGGSI
jgi:hypothetical protein